MVLLVDGLSMKWMLLVDCLLILLFNGLFRGFDLHVALVVCCFTVFGLIRYFGVYCLRLFDCNSWCL